MECQGIPTNWKWKKEEKKLNTNILESKAMQLVLLSFFRQTKMKAIHFQIDSITTLSNFLKIGVAGNKKLIDLTKEIRRHNSYRVRTQFFKCESRFLVAELQGQLWMETSSIIFLPEVDFFASLSVKSATKVHGLEIRAIQSANRCNETLMVKPVLYIFLPFSFVNSLKDNRTG